MSIVCSFVFWPCLPALAAVESEWVDGWCCAGWSNHILYSLLQILYILHTLSLSSLLMCCPVPEMSCSCFCWVLVTDLSGVCCSSVACCVLEMFLAWPVQTFLAFAGTAAEQPFLAWNQTCAWWPGTSGTGVDQLVPGQECNLAGLVPGTTEQGLKGFLVTFPS